MVDIRKFFNVWKGAIYFVVTEEKSYEARHIFYKVLLPYDLAKILETGGGKNSTTVKFDLLPDDPVQLERICREFLANQNLQGTVKAIGIHDWEGMRDRGPQFTEVHMVKTFLSSEPVLSLDAFKSGTYLYATTSWGEKYVVDKLEDIKSLETSLSYHDVSCGDVTKRCLVSLLEEDDGRRTIRFDNFCVGLDDPATINFSIKGTFTERYDTARLARGLVESGSFSIDGRVFEGEAQGDEELRDRLSNSEKALAPYARLMETLSVKSEWDPDALKDSDFRLLAKLGRAFVEDKTVEIAEGDGNKALCAYFEIGGKRVKVFAYLMDDGKYRLQNPLAPESCFWTSVYGPEMEPVRCILPGLLILDKEDFLLACNLDAGAFEESLEKHPINELGACFANDRLLLMLEAYDQGALCQGELIECCRLLADRLRRVGSHDPNYTINYYQVLKREGDLDEAAISELRNLAINSSDRLVRAGANALMGRNEDASMCLEGLSAQDAEKFMGWPIARFLNE